MSKTSGPSVTGIAALAAAMGYRLVPVATTDEPVLRALETLWTRLRAGDPRVPGAVFSLQPGRPSSCGTIEWGTPPGVVVTNLKHDDTGQNLTGREILPFLLHHAAHGAAGISAGAEGRYHSAAFRDAAASLGLAVSGTPVPGLGYTPEGLARGAVTRYGSEVRALDRAMSSWNPAVRRKRERGPLSYACSCDPPRRFRMARGTAGRGPIICSICRAPFTVA